MMMRQLKSLGLKSVVLCGCLCYLGINLAAQEVEPKVLAPKIVDISETYFGLSIGPSMPTDNFAASVPRIQSGFAKTGLKLSLDGAFIFFKNLGLGWSFGYTNHSVNTDTYVDKLMYHLPEGQMQESGTFDNKNWLNTYLTIGPYISLPEENFTFDFAFLLGLNYSVTPEINYTGIFNGQPLNSRIERNTSIGSALLVSASVGRHIQENWRVFLKGEMFFSRPKFREISQFTADSFDIQSNDTFRQSIALINASLGIAYEFENNKKKDYKRKFYSRKFRRMNREIMKGDR